MDWRFSITLAFFVCSGCAQTALVRSWQPAQIDVSGIERIAVIDFQGPQGPAVSAAMTSRLWENEFYSLVDRSELEPVLQAGFSGHQVTGLSDVLASARTAHVNAVLMGEVVAYECTDRTSSNTEFHFGQDHEHSRTAQGESQHHGSGFGFATNEILTREGTVTLAFRLVDAESGDIRASRTVSRHFEGQQVNGQGTLPPPGEVLETLLDECLDESVAMLAPHPVDCQMDLARGRFFCPYRRRVQSGIALAKRGQWSQAEHEWRQVIDSYAEHDAALFNLALAAAHRHDYAAAEDLAMQALRIRHTDCYARGLEQIRSQRSSFQETEAQREARVVPALVTVWK